MRNLTTPVLSTLLALAAPAVAAPATGGVTGTVKVEGAASARTVVYIESVGEEAEPPAAVPEMVQENSAFVPGSLVVLQGQEVGFPNRDKFFHNIFSVSPDNEFDLGLFRGGSSKSTRMNVAGEVDVFCNIHPNMAAKILVLQNPHFVEVDAAGHYSLAGVPPGSYKLVAWSATHVPVSQPVEIKAGAAAKASFTLKPRPASSHLNKDGEQYGRYK